MSQNTSTAVMARRIEPDDSLDDFPTPPFAARALLEHVLIPGGVDPSRLRIWEPACNRGHLAAPLEDYAAFLLATDIADYSAAVDLSPHWAKSGRRSDGLLDFLDPAAELAGAFEGAFTGAGGERWVITNPPFNAAAAFQARAAGLDAHCALFVRTAFVEGAERYQSLFRPAADPPAIVAHFSERVCLLKGRLVRRGARDPKRVDETGDESPVTSATAYSWIIWNRAWRAQYGCTRTVWIPPCIIDLERPGDYPAYPPGYFAVQGETPDMARPPAPAQGALF